MAVTTKLHRKEEKLHHIAERAMKADEKVHEKLEKAHKREDKTMKKKKHSKKKHKKMGKGKAKVKKVMREFKEGELHSGSKKGPMVKNPKQAIAIALSEARKSGAKIPKKKKR